MRDATDRINVVVREVLEDITGASAETIRPRDRLVDDLKATGDDLSFVFVPAVERQLGVHVPQDAWRRVFTVQDAVEVLRVALAERP